VSACDCCVEEHSDVQHSSTASTDDEAGELHTATYTSANVDPQQSTSRHIGNNHDSNKLCRRPPQYAPAPCKLTFDLLTSKVVSESRVMWATSVPILVFLCFSVLDLGPMYVTDRRQTDRFQTCIIA